MDKLKNVGAKFSNWINEDNDYIDEEDEFEEDEMPETQKSVFESPKSQMTTDAIDALDNKPGDLNLIEPRSFKECLQIVDLLKQRKGVVINLHRMPKEHSKSLVDFVQGAIYALDGDIQEIGSAVILCTPKTMSVAGSISNKKNQ